MKRKKKKIVIQHLSQKEKLKRSRKVSPRPQKAFKDKKKYDRKGKHKDV